MIAATDRFTFWLILALACAVPGIGVAQPAASNTFGDSPSPGGVDPDSPAQLFTQNQTVPSAPSTPSTLPVQDRAMGNALLPVQPQNRTVADRLFARQSLPTRQTFRPLLSAPNLFGDTTDGGCGQAEFLLGTASASLEHPTFNCLRANLAENNSPLPRDRVYLRYNHFHNITEISIFPPDFPDGISSLNVDRVTLGTEVTMLDEQLSLEVRLPFARQLTSDMYLYDIQGDYNLPIDDYRTELLNMQFIFKALLWQTENLAISSGLCLNVPTAQDFNLRIFVDDDEFEVGPGAISVDLDIAGSVANSTYNLSPFLAYLWTPRPRIFTQGFWQLDVPLNTSATVVSGTAGPPGNQIIIPPDRGALHQQTLMRFNVGAGYWLLQRPDARILKGWAGVLELHYTTTLQDADLNAFEVPLVQFQPPLPPITLGSEIVVGNLANRVDVLNLALGSHFQLWERTTLGVSIVAPLRSDTDKPFDAEINVLLNYAL